MSLPSSRFTPYIRPLSSSSNSSIFIPTANLSVTENALAYCKHPTPAIPACSDASERVCLKTDITHRAQAHGESSARNDDDESEQEECDEEANAPTRPVPDFPVRTTRSGLKRDGGGGGSTMLVLDEAVHPPIAFSAGLPAGFSSRGCPIPATCVRRWPLPTPKAGRRPWTKK